jgi:hypothetical protein
MTIAVDKDEVRRHIEIISAHVVKLAAGLASPGVLQLLQLNCVDKDPVPARFQIDDVQGMVKFATAAAEAGANVYIEPRTVRADLKGRKRGGLADTVFVFTTVVDADHDKGKGGTVILRPSLSIASSLKNLHHWYLHDRPTTAGQSKTIGDAVRAATGTDGDTGVVTQPFRIAGTPNYPSKEKIARGRTDVEPTWLVEQSDRLWDPDELLEAHKTPSAASQAPQAPCGAPTGPDEATLPDELLKAIRDGGVSKGNGAGGDKSRSGLFHHVVAELEKRQWTVEAIHALLARYPQGVAAKFQSRLLEEIKRSFGKVNGNGNGAGLFIISPAAGPAARVRARRRRRPARRPASQEEWGEGPRKPRRTCCGRSRSSAGT